MCACTCVCVWCVWVSECEGWKKGEATHIIMWRVPIWVSTWIFLVHNIYRYLMTRPHQSFFISLSLSLSLSLFILSSWPRVTKTADTSESTVAWSDRGAFFSLSLSLPTDQTDSHHDEYYLNWNSWPKYQCIHIEREREREKRQKKIYVSSIHKQTLWTIGR